MRLECRLFNFPGERVCSIYHVMSSQVSYFFMNHYVCKLTTANVTATVIATAAIGCCCHCCSLGAVPTVPGGRHVRSHCLVLLAQYWITHVHYPSTPLDARHLFFPMLYGPLSSHGWSGCPGCHSGWRSTSRITTTSTSPFPGRTGVGVTENHSFVDR